ncbi:uncharacterized protein N7487_004328 [Penicillium crustosum]|uniref:uncharacterized protein n=1 Tax=Penicillium crustosum TaxID=36656 RepID=UPI002391CE11|nr:uncharacterized protein N7487_004328 [Penicillium crustosum]KAJ5409969.1 hypothetical protein N7487_004328 [Penicillium crustosum]
MATNHEETRPPYGHGPTSRRQAYNPVSVTALANRATWVATKESSDEPKLNMGHSHRLPDTTGRRDRTRPDKHKAHDPHAELTSSSTLQPADTSDEKNDIAPDSGSGGSPLSQPAHTLTYEDVIKELTTELDDGLPPDEASRRLQQYGPNQLDEGEGVSLVKIFVRQVANAMMLVLILAMAVSFGIQSWIEGGVICAVIVLNIVVGFFQEYAAEKTMESLHSLSSPTGTVSRGGQTFSAPSSEIVPGDMIELRTGDTVPADIRLVEIVNFETDEALLIGESLPVQKECDSTFKEDTGPRDRLNIAYSSSTVTRGRGRGVVISIGMFTEIGSIALVLRASDSKRRPVKHGPNGESKKRWYI